MWPSRKKETVPTEWRATSNKPRVLIEHHDPAIASAVSNLLLDAGFETASCDGPDGHRQCPLVQGTVCPRAEEADLVVFGLDITDEDDRAVLASLKAHAAGRPIVVEATPLRASLYKDELEGCEVVARPFNRTTLLNAIDRALR